MTDPEREGWFALRRGWRELVHVRPQPFDDFSAALWAIENAAWMEHERWFNGHRVALERGQLVTSRATMVKAFGWTLKRVRCFEERLLKAGFWAVERAPLYTVLTICNFDQISPPLVAEGHRVRPQEDTAGAQEGPTREQRQHEKHVINGRARAIRAGGASRSAKASWSPEPISAEEARRVGVRA